MAIDSPGNPTGPAKGPSMNANKSTQAQSTRTDEKTESETDRTKSNLFELILTSSKGYGLFATENIPRGTCILAESPLMTTPFEHGNYRLLGMDAQGLTSKLKSLSPQQHQTFFALYHNPDAIDRIKKQLLQDFQEQKDNTSNRYPHKFQDPQALVKLSAIYLSNMLKLGYSREFGTGVFPLYSRINFSCVPNLQAHYNSATQKLVVHAVRHINKGEELLTRFHAKACRTREQRNAMFKVRGFKCRCKACVGKEAYASNERRKAMLHLDIGLEAYDKSTEARLAVSVPRGANEALEMALELLELFRQEGILDCELQSVYRRCSQYSLQAGHFDKAVNYAKKERDIERFCIGKDTAHLEENMKGAEFWLKYVLSERDQEQARRRATDQWFNEAMAPEPKAKKNGKGKKK